MRAILVASLLVSATAFAGSGSSTTALKSAIATGSADSIIAELERAEFLACLGCLNPVLKLVDNPSYKVRDAAGWWLGRRAARNEVLSMAKSRLAAGAQDPVYARNIADALGAMHENRALPELGAFLANPLDDESGVAVARAIGRIGSPASVSALEVGTKSQFSQVRAQSLMALRDLRHLPDGKSPLNLNAVTPLLSDSDANVRREAAYTLGQKRDASTVPALEATLGDSNAQVRKAVAWALGQIGSVGAAQALSDRASNDGDPLVRSIAKAALARLH